MPLAATEVN